MPSFLPNGLCEMSIEVQRTLREEPALTIAVRKRAACKVCVIAEDSAEGDQ
jgi:hypothetical protein